MRGFEEWTIDDVIAHNIRVNTKKGNPVKRIHVQCDLSKPVRSKYGATKTQEDGFVFDSKKEAKRYKQLKLMERGGLIHDLELQVEFEIQPSFEIAGEKVLPIKYAALVVENQRFGAFGERHAALNVLVRIVGGLDGLDGPSGEQCASGNNGNIDYANGLDRLQLNIQAAACATVLTFLRPHGACTFVDAGNAGVGITAGPGTAGTLVIVGLVHANRVGLAQTVNSARLSADHTTFLDEPDNPLLHVAIGHGFNALGLAQRGAED